MEFSLNPIRVLKREADEKKAEMARLSSFVGGISVGDFVKSTLGPKGMDKILISPNIHKHQVAITNDGATILRSLPVNNPGARIIVDIANVQDVEVGDGTTSVAVLAAEMLRGAEKLISQHIHPQTIVTGWRLATKVAIDALTAVAEDHSENVKEFHDDLLHIACTILSSKILNQHCDFFANLALKAVLRLNGSNNINAIQFIKKTGGTLLDSFLDDGFLLDGKPGMHQPQRIENAKILLANTGMDTDKVKVFGYSMTVKSFDQMAAIEMAQKEYMQGIVKNIINQNINVFINQQSIYNYAEQLFADAGIMAIEQVELDGIERLALATGGEIASSFDNERKIKLGECALIEPIMIGEDTLLRLSGIKMGKACTIVIRGATKQIVEEAERSLHDVVSVLAATQREALIVYGGGCAEAVMANAVMQRAQLTAGKEAFAMNVFAEALLELPTTIAKNAGLDATKLITKLRAEHAQRNIYAGLNMKEAKIGNMKELGIIESFKVKIHMLLSAVEAAEMILRVDNIVFCESRKYDNGCC